MAAYIQMPAVSANATTAIGAEVSVVEAAPRLLPIEEEDISEHLAREFKSRGIHLYTGWAVESSTSSEKSVSLNLRHPNGEARTLQADVVLVAAGIVGNVEKLGLEGTRVRVERSHVVTSDNCETDEPGVFAIGDLAGPPWLAHKASHEAVSCVEGIAGLPVHRPRLEDVPSCTYCHPQVASVGLTERAARNAGMAVRVGRFPFSANGKAIAAGSTSGFVKSVFDANTGELLGAHLIGDEVTELIQGNVIARQLETTSDELIQTIFPHPTLSEALHESVLASQGRGLHM